MTQTNTAVVYNHRDNDFYIFLTLDGVAVPYAQLTKVALVIGSQVIDSVLHPSLLMIGTDRITAKLGGANLAARTGYNARIVGFDDDHINGLVYGEFMFDVID